MNNEIRKSESCPICGKDLFVDSKDSNNTNCIDINCSYNQIEDIQLSYNCDVLSNSELFHDDNNDDDNFDDDYDWGSLFD